MRLEQKLKDCAKIPFPEETQARLKKSVMAHLTQRNVETPEVWSFEILIQAIKKITAQIMPSPPFRGFLKEKLITLMEFEHAKEASNRLFGMKRYRRALVTIVAVLFVVTAVFNAFPSFQVQRAEASFVTTLEEVTGEVTIIRDSKEFAGRAGFLLKSDDAIRTGKSSKAIIRFPDQSISRLAENTEIKISTLFINPTNKTETVVELVLEKGRLWSRVVNLIDNLSRFQVKANNTVVVVKRRAAFDVAILTHKKTKVSAVQNRVDLVVATNSKKVVETTLVKGFTAEVKTGRPIVSQQETESDFWVQENLEQDNVYIESVKQETQQALRDQVKMLPGNPLYMVKELTETTKLAFTFDEFQKQEKILQSAEEKLGQAEVLLEKGDLERAKLLLNEFQTLISGVLEFIRNYEATDPGAVLGLKTNIKNMLNTYQKQLAVLLPTDLLYTLKETIGDAQVLAAGDQTQKTQEKLSQAGERLLEAHELIEQGDAEAAKQQVKAYSESVSEVVSEVKQLPSDQKEKAVTVLLDTKREDLKSMEAITAVETNSIAGSSSDIAVSSGSSSPEIIPAGTGTSSVVSPQQQEEINEAVSEAKTESLSKISEVVLDVQEKQSSPEVLKKIENINTLEVNGKSVVDVTLSQNKITIKSDGTSLSIGSTSVPASSPTPTLPTVNSELPKLPQG